MISLQHSLSYFLFFFSFIFISWRLITLQYFSGFCHTLAWISHGCTCVPHPEPPSHFPPHPLITLFPYEDGICVLVVNCLSLRVSLCHQHIWKFAYILYSLFVIYCSSSAGHINLLSSDTSFTWRNLTLVYSSLFSNFNK